MSKEKLQTILGEGTIFNGDLVSEGIVRLDGRFSGHINAGIVIIGKNAVVHADIKCDDLSVYGKIKGNVVARNNIEIFSEGELTGDMKAVSSIVREGGSFTGKCELKSCAQEERA